MGRLELDDDLLDRDLGEPRVAVAVVGDGVAEGAQAVRHPGQLGEVLAALEEGGGDAFVGEVLRERQGARAGAGRDGLAGAVVEGEDERAVRQRRAAELFHLEHGDGPLVVRNPSNAL